jgi:hypothetical protein
MSFQWLQMRITEEKERREREARILERLPRALEDLHGSLSSCIEAYTAAFGEDAADLRLTGLKVRIIVRDSTDLGWKECGRVEIDAVPAMPGFEVRSTGSTLAIEIGLLPGDKLFYRDREVDQYLTMEELTRRILDRALFPKLKE